MKPAISGSVLYLDSNIFIYAVERSNPWVEVAEDLLEAIETGRVRAVASELVLAEVLAKPYAQQLLNGPEPARMAYEGLDGDPRVIPIGFWTEGARVVMATVPRSAKVAALRTNPKVALTIDQGAFPPKALLIRGTAAVKLVEGIPDGYLTAGRKVMSDDQYPGWVAGVQGLYDEMVVITITPTWAKLLDFETTLPKSVEDLIKEKATG